MRIACAAGLVLVLSVAAGAEDALPPYLGDRGSGVATSMFGSYVRKGEVMVYPFFEYYRDHDFEYKPEEFGVPGAEDFRGGFRAREGLIFLGYGLGENLAIEMEAAVIKASLEKAPGDTSPLPARVEESGLGDVEGQVRWRWRKETGTGPELFSYGEFVIPHHGEKTLIGTAGWEFMLGTGVTRGFNWGTLTARAAVSYSAASTSKLDLGEYAVEYLKRVSPSWRFYVGLEGSQDELSLIAEAQWHVTRNMFVRFNTGVGLTSKATDWTPELGILFTLPTRRTPRP
jgi:hypothetical protein